MTIVLEQTSATLYVAYTWPCSQTKDPGDHASFLSQIQLSDKDIRTVQGTSLIPCDGLEDTHVGRFFFKDTYHLYRT